MTVIGIKDVLAISPEIIVAGGASLLLLLDLLLGEKRRIVTVTLAFLLVVAAAIGSACIFRSDISGGTFFSGMFVVDDYSTFFKFVFYFAAALTILISFRYMKDDNANFGEYYVLMLFSLSGMMVMASGTDLLSIYMGLELMSIPVYVLAGFAHNDSRSSEGAMKYVILGAFSSGILLYGISFIYGLTGTTELHGVAAALTPEVLNDPVLGIALILMVAGFAFKVAGVPFHMWAPDAYEGAPTPITGFISVASKAAAFAAMIRIFMGGLGPAYDKWFVLVALISVASMFYGNITAIAQSNIKRMLAYSSIGHAGYALLGVAVGTGEGAGSVMFYSLVYVFMTLGAFTIVVVLRKEGRDGETIEDYAGLSKTHPLLAFLMMVFMFSLAGIPPAAGFMGKFYVFMALIHKGMIGLAIAAVLMSAVAAYFYIRVIMLMYMKEPAFVHETAPSKGVSYALAVSLVMVVALGVYPNYVIEFVRMAGSKAFGL
ncbi:MAG: NADH-quinone oxidoreductase subunit N [Thermodesulfobacteriota bacterium]